VSRQPLFILFALLLCSISEWSVAAAPALADAKQPPTVTYLVSGVLRKIHADGITAQIAHEEIPDYMPAMTMDFTAREPGVLAGLKAGDAISFRLSVGHTESWIDRVQRVPSAVSPEGAAGSDPAALPAEAKQLRAGDRLPRIPLVDQNSRRFSLDTLRGKAWAFTFIFTRCPLPEYCPRLSRHFAAAQRALSEEEGISVRCHFLSITIDPEFDTPARLAAYAKLYGADPARWTFATGDPADLAKLSGAFGVEVARTGAQLDHNLRTVVVDADGRVQRIFIGNEWEPEDLVRELRHAVRASAADSRSED